MKHTAQILILGINYAPELTGIGKYNSGMAEYLIKQGIKCTVITGFPFYPQWKLQSPYKTVFYKKEIFHDGLLTIYRCPIYIPNKPSGFKRIAQETSFILSSFAVICKYLFRISFSAVIVISPPFYIGITGLIYKYFKKTSLIYHVQDLQIELAQETKLLKNRYLIKLMFHIEKYILTNVDYVSTISEGMITKIKSKRNVKTILFPNWVETDIFYPITNREPLRLKWKFNASDKIILYSGNIGEKQGLDNVLIVASRFLDLPDYKFIICGDGAYKSRLIQKAMQLHVPNVFFMPLQPISEFNNFLNIADVHLILHKNGSDDLVMPSKLTNILAVGGNVIATAGRHSSLYKMLSENDIGTVIMPDDPDLLYQAILKGTEIDLRNCKKARDFALCHLAYEAIMKRFIEKIDIPSLVSHD